MEVRWKIAFYTEEVFKSCEKLKMGYCNRKCATSGICYWPHCKLGEHSKNRCKRVYCNAEKKKEITIRTPK